MTEIKNAKKLSLAGLKNESKKYSEKVKVDLPGGFYLNVEPNFDPVKIDDAILEYSLDYKEAKDAGIDLQQIVRTDWLYLIMIRYFTDLSIPKDIKKKVQFYSELRKQPEIFEAVVKAFSLDSLNMFLSKMENVNNNLNSYFEMDEKDKKIIEEAYKSLNPTGENDDEKA